jgi:unsaturated rhamnogalacturonyl hydrolase
MKTKLIVITFILMPVFAAYAESKYYVRMADSEIKRNPEAWMLDFSN